MGNKNDAVGYESKWIFFVGGETADRRSYLLPLFVLCTSSNAHSLQTARKLSADTGALGLPSTCETQATNRINVWISFSFFSEYLFGLSVGLDMN
jgi:hypothetical protein